MSTAEQEFEWREDSPPPGTREYRDWDSILQRLDTRPGQWAIVARDLSPSSVTRLKHRYSDYEFRNRNIDRSSEKVDEVWGRRIP